MWRNDTKPKYMFMFRLKNLARKGLINISEMTKETLVWFFLLTITFSHTEYYYQLSLNIWL